MPEKREKNVGYVLLAIGLSVILISIIIAFFILMGTISIPEVIEPPSGTDTGTMGELVNMLASFGDVFLAFFLLIVVEYGGGVIMSRGVRLIKEIKLSAVGEVSGEELVVKKKGKIEKKGK